MRMGWVIVALGALSACASEVWYDIGQGWREEQCRRLQDPAERTRCERSKARSYEDYQAEAAKARASAPR
jgi:hypothetical protein